MGAFGVDGFKKAGWSRLLALVGLALLVAACSSSTEEETAAGSASSSGSPSTDAAAVEAGPTQAERSAAVRGAEQQLARVRGQVEGLRQRAEIAGVEAEGSTEATIAAVENDLHKAERSLASLKQAGDAEWATAKSGAEQSLSGLGNKVDRVEADIRAKSEAQRAERIEAIKPLMAKGLIEGLDGETYLSYKRSVIEQVQEKLADDGIYDGPIDGWLELTTQRAVGAFQEKIGLRPTGMPSPNTRAALMGGGEESQ
jgi:TolA-binding protein